MPGKYNASYHREYYLRHREKKIAMTKAWKLANPEKSKGYRENEVDMRLRRVFGITLEEYEALVEQQNGVCAICKRGEKSKRLAVDHCHNSKKVRGLLCSKCNQALGMVGDSIEILENAILYLKK